jgi:hypothetical protein
MRALVNSKVDAALLLHANQPLARVIPLPDTFAQ